MARSAKARSMTLTENKSQIASLKSNARYMIRGITSLLKADKHECNLCGYIGRFGPFGDPPRRGAVCAGCGSKERHRLMALWVSANAESIAGAGILHFAPEPLLTKVFSSHSSAYQSADLDPRFADTVLNIEAIDMRDASVDIIVCSHVLEHVDDTKALKELHRILKPGGRVLLMFPIVEGWEHTYEDARHTSDSDRVRYYGQRDHVRMFGRDVRQRIERAGFILDEFTAEEPAVSRFGLMRGEKVFVATKGRA